MTFFVVKSSEYQFNLYRAFFNFLKIYAVFSKRCEICGEEQSIMLIIPSALRQTDQPLDPSHANRKLKLLYIIRVGDRLT